jgi:hypothetical protein
MFTFDVVGRVRHVYWIVVRATPPHGIGRPSPCRRRPPRDVAGASRTRVSRATSGMTRPGADELPGHASAVASAQRHSAVRRARRHDRRVPEEPGVHDHAAAVGASTCVNSSGLGVRQAVLNPDTELSLDGCIRPHPMTARCMSATIGVNCSDATAYEGLACFLRTGEPDRWWAHVSGVASKKGLREFRPFTTVAGRLWSAM